MWNVKFNHKIFFFLHFVYSNEETKSNKTKQNCCKISIKPLNYALGGETAFHVNFMQHMLVHACCFSSVEGDIGEVSKILTSGSYFELVYIQYRHVCQYRPVFR